MSDIDYKAEAARNIDVLHDFQSEEGITDASLLTVAIETQVLATLYLAEQQRIANLIAFTSRPGFIQTPDILQQIEKGLGI